MDGFHFPHQIGIVIEYAIPVSGCVCQITTTAVHFGVAGGIGVGPGVLRFCLGSFTIPPETGLPGCRIILYRRYLAYKEDYSTSGNRN